MLVGHLMLVSPDIPQPGFCEMVRSGYFRGIAALGVRSTMRLARVTSWAEQIEAEVLAGRRAMRLEAMAVLPARQGHGVGTKLLQHVLHHADATRFPVILSTQDSRSAAFYSRLGFAVAREEVYPPADMRSWCMLREPVDVGSGDPCRDQ